METGRVIRPRETRPQGNQLHAGQPGAVERDRPGEIVGWERGLTGKNIARSQRGVFSTIDHDRGTPSPPPSATTRWVGGCARDADKTKARSAGRRCLPSYYRNHVHKARKGLVRMIETQHRQTVKYGHNLGIQVSRRSNTKVLQGRTGLRIP